MKFNEVAQVANLASIKDAKLRSKSVPRNQQLKYVNTWRSSNLSRPDFCKLHNIKPKNFYSWIKNSEQVTQSISPPAEADNTKLVNSIDGFKLSLPSGAVLSIAGNIEQELLLTIVGRLLSCKSS